MKVLFLIRLFFQAIENYLGYLKNKHNNKIVFFLAFLALALFSNAGWIVEALPPYKIETYKNIPLRFDFYALGLLAYYLTDELRKTNWSVFFKTFIIALSLSDVIDRYFFNLREYTWNDVLVVLLVFYAKYHKHIKVKK